MNKNAADNWWKMTHKIYVLKQKIFSPSKTCPKIDVVDSMVAKKNKKKTFKDSDQNLDKALQNPNTKMIIDFEWEHSVSINSLAAN